MAIIHKKRLMLVDVIEIELKNGVKKFKYTFITSDNKLMNAYDNTGEYADLVVDCDGKYDDILAHEFCFTPKEFKGVVSEKLMPRAGEVKTKNKQR